MQFSRLWSCILNSENRSEANDTIKENKAGLTVLTPLDYSENNTSIEIGKLEILLMEGNSKREIIPIILGDRSPRVFPGNSLSFKNDPIVLDLIYNRLFSLPNTSLIYQNRSLLKELLFSYSIDKKNPFLRMILDTCYFLEQNKKYYNKLK